MDLENYVSLKNKCSESKIKILENWEILYRSLSFLEMKL